MLVPFRPDITGTVRMEPVLGALLADFETWYQPLRRPQPHFKAALAHSLKVIALNVVGATLASDSAWVALPGRKAWYQENQLLLGPLITHASVETVVRFLREEGYVRFRSGRASKSKAFRRPNLVQPSRKLRTLAQSFGAEVADIHSDPKAFPLRLRAKRDETGSRRYIPLSITGETLIMEDRVATINRVLLHHWPDLEVTDQQMEEMLGYMAKRDGSERTIDFGKRTLYRVFNNGTLEDGGRFYGGWWQEIPKAYRPYITINGKRTVEVDYSAIHPTFLYHEVGLPKPEDPYAIGLGSREVVKRTFNALINAKGISIKPVEGFDPEAVGMTWNEFLRRVKDRFLPFKPYFGTGYGLKLQRLDSDIAEAVMLHFAKRDIPVLPVHDSFIVHHGYEAELAMVMEDKFREVTGASINLKPSALSTEQVVAMSDLSEAEHQRLLSQGMSEIDALLSRDHAFGQYEARLSDWFSRKTS
ncbi:hypothetical protein [Devosia sp. CN2-171]|uniref:hypothetical protein n=1 Tax=Devosia sp. CN2-171 TaxID=3400909 RepID=UPI003BF799CD